MPAPPADRSATERIQERLLRAAYSAVLYLLLPVTLYHLVWRGFRQYAYLLRWSERYAFYGDRVRPGSGQDGHIWVHAVSMGEVNAVAPLVNALLRRYPQQRLLLTTITPTGSDRVRALWGERVTHVYAPYDIPGAVARFLHVFRPRIGLIVETELWPNLLFACRDRGIPAYLVNARLSERSLRGYRPLRPLVGRALRTLRTVAAQSEGDAARFARLGARADQLLVCGNLKYDTPVDTDAVAATVAEFRARSGARPAWIAASTHPEEEPLVLAIHQRLRARHPDLLLLWAPRHPERFRPAVQQALDAGLQVATRSLTVMPGPEDAVFVVDTLGELMRFYACADVAFVGGSLQPIGGHNLLEPAAVGTPVVTGPHLHNFTDIAAQLRGADALLVGEDATAVGDALQRLLDDPQRRAAMAASGRALVEQGRGALQRTLDLIAPEVTPSETAPSETTSSV